MKKPKFAIAPEGCKNNLTAGKKYKIFEWKSDKLFTILSDKNYQYLCAITGCVHLDGGDWILTN